MRVQKSNWLTELLVQQRDQASPQRRDRAGAAGHSTLPIHLYLIASLRYRISYDVRQPPASTSRQDLQRLLQTSTKQMRLIGGAAGHDNDVFSFLQHFFAKYSRRQNACYAYLFTLENSGALITCNQIMRLRGIRQVQ